MTKINPKYFLIKKCKLKKTFKKKLTKVWGFVILLLQPKKVAEMIFEN